MSDILIQRNIGSVVKAVQSVRPQAAAASVNGVSIDRLAHNMPLSAVLYTALGASSGAPTSFTVTPKVQDSADNSTFADYLPDGVHVAADAALAAVNTDSNFAVNLSSARRYVRVVHTVAFVGGTSPTILTAGVLVLAGEQEIDAI